MEYMVEKKDKKDFTTYCAKHVMQPKSSEANISIKVTVNKEHFFIKDTCSHSMAMLCCTRVKVPL